MKLQDAKMSNLEYCTTNINRQCWPPFTRPKCHESNHIFQPPMSLGSHRALTLPQTWSHKLGVEVASWHHCPTTKIYNVCNENLVEDE